ncbi:tetratricopeptide repeat protein [Candidatus Poribacteria bacterium]|nr:tetratricopeptide repeat protein [Candidatus Poribacteria bacterium]
MGTYLPISYCNRGIAKRDLGHPEDAISDFDEAIRIDSEYTSAYYNRGKAQIMLERTMEGEQDLQKALNLAENAGNGRFKNHILEELSKIGK